MSYKLLYCAIFLCSLIAIRHRYLDHFDYRAFHFKNYLRNFNKSYGGEEFKRRMLYFEESLEEIERLNHGPLSTGAVYGLTKFSDWHKDEFKDVMLQKGNTCNDYAFNYCSHGQEKSALQYGRTYKEMLDFPEKFDWRNVDRVIGPVRNQKLCSGCWAFGIVGVMEAMAAISKIGYDNLSVQQLIDCSSGNHKCQGGNIDSALILLCLSPNLTNLTTEAKYPDMLVDEICKPGSSGKRAVKNFEVICDFNDETILKNLMHGPVMVVVKPVGWTNYVGGIIVRNCFDTDKLSYTHVVQVVGYDMSTDIHYFIIKNSFGTDWGEDGYIRVAMSKHKNLCGLYDHMAWLDVK